LESVAGAEPTQCFQPLAPKGREDYEWEGARVEKETSPRKWERKLRSETLRDGTSENIKRKPYHSK
jgi:hypothetical protein